MPHIKALNLMCYLSMLISTPILADDHFKFSANLVDLAMYSDESSVDDQFTNSGALIFGADYKIFGTDYDFGTLKAQYTFNGLNNDAQLNTTTNWFGGVGSYVGGAIAMNDIAPSQLSLLTWDKKWANDLIFTSVGRTNLRRYFLFNNCQNLAICTDPIKGSMGSLPANYGYWGAYFKYNFNEHLYFHSGIFEVNTDDYVHEKKGLDFSFHHDLGYTQVYSLGYKNDHSKVEALYFSNDSEYANALTKQKYRDTDGINIRFSYDFKDSYLSNLYGAYSQILEKNQPYDHYWELGAMHKINARGDHIGLKFGQSELNDDFYAFTQKLNGNQHKTTTFVSFDAAIKYKKVTFSPFVQYIWNPDNYYRSNQGGFDHNVIMGLLTQVKLY